MRDGPPVTDYSFATTVETPPYLGVSQRFRNGIKQSAFHGLIGRHGKVLKLHDTYLKPYYIDGVLEEYWALRKEVGLFDVTGEQVIEIRGPGAFDLMDELVPRDLGRLADGACIYAIMCYDYGGIVEDGVLIRFDRERFWWVGGLGYAEQWIWANARGRDVEIVNRLDEIHIASIQGPKSRDVLQRICAADLSALPYYGMVETSLCGVSCVVTRTGYTGELGYEIYLSICEAERVFEGLQAECQAAGGRLCGSGCTAIRRIEAGLIDFGTDFDWHHTPYEVGLEWMLDTQKAGYRGRDALIGTALARPARRLAGVKLEGERVATAGDPVFKGSSLVGEVRSATFSPALERSIAIALLSVAATKPETRIEVEHRGRRIAGAVAAMPFLDPERRLARA